MELKNINIGSGGVIELTGKDQGVQNQSAEAIQLSDVSFRSSYGRSLILTSLSAAFGISAIGTQNGCSNADLLRQGPTVLVDDHITGERDDRNSSSAKASEMSHLETSPTSSATLHPPSTEPASVSNTRAIQHTVISKHGQAPTVVLIQNVPSSWFETPAKPSLDILVGRALDIAPGPNYDDALKARIARIKDAFNIAKSGDEVREILGKIIAEDFNPPKIPQPQPDSVG